MNINTVSTNSNDLLLHIEKFENPKIDTRISYPNHVILCGTTQSGKSSLIARILDNIDQVYAFPTKSKNESVFKSKKIIIFSPMDEVEIAKLMKTKNEWEISLYNIMSITRDVETEIRYAFSESQNLINILLLDDFLVQSNEHQMQIINSIYSTYRHLNVCVISTIHSYHKKFLTILEQSGLVISMYGFAQVSFLRNIMKSKIFKGTADIIREIQKLFRTRMKAHSYISLNFSKEAICSEKFFVTDSVFRPDHGIVLKQILEKM